jgi:hypothetical protein
MSLSDFPGVKTLPKYESEFLKFMNPVLDAMREKAAKRGRAKFMTISRKS